MPSLPSRLLTASRAALLAFQNSFNEDAAADSYATSRANYYELLWSFYKSDAFEDIKFWGPYRSHFRLYRQTRLIYNPVRQLCDFYAEQVYPGVLSLDGSKLPEGVALAIPLAEDTPDDIKKAIAQFWQWTNFQDMKSTYVLWGAIFGSVLVEVIDDLAARKVTAQLWRPDHIADLTLDGAGNVKAYALQFIDVTPDGQRYTYRKEVDRSEIRYFRDGRPFDYGNGAVVENILGFCPAVWARHRNIGYDDGAPAIYGSMGPIRELNSLASHLHDRIHLDANAPVMLWGGGDVAPLVAANRKRGATEDEPDQTADRESLAIMTSLETQGRADSLASKLDWAAIFAYQDKCYGEIERKHPELTFWSELRGMSQVTGPAASRLMGDVAGKVIAAQAGYDQQTIKLFQMALANAGMRANNGDWGELDRQRSKFLPFDLASYVKGELDFDITPRPLIPPTEAERIQAERARLALEAERLTVAGGGQSTIQAKAATPAA